jgi:elongation factor Ts
MHRKSPDLPPQVGVAVGYTGKSDEAGESEARGIAMQIAAMRPKYVTRDEVPDDVVATERRIAEETAREEGKPEAALPKIVDGRVNGFFKDFVLVEQASVADNKKTVKQVLAEAGIEVTRFVRFEVGQA